MTRLDVSVSPEALRELVARLAPEGQSGPEVTLGEGQAEVRLPAQGTRLELAVGSLRLELRADGLRLFTEPPASS